MVGASKAMWLSAVDIFASTIQTDLRRSWAFVQVHWLTPIFFGRAEKTCNAADMPTAHKSDIQVNKHCILLPIGTKRMLLRQAAIMCTMAETLEISNYTQVKGLLSLSGNQ